MSQKDVESYVEFSDNHLLALVFGEHDSHLKLIEQSLDVDILAHGNQVRISGDTVAVAAAQRVLESLYQQVKKQGEITAADIDAAIKMTLAPHEKKDVRKKTPSGPVKIQTRRKTITARTPGQEKYMQTLQDYNLVFALGPAGTGKTYLAAATGVMMLLEGKVDRIIMSRPAVEAGERLGFLPGDMREKVDPYLRPLYDALYDMLPPEQVEKRIEKGELEVAPLAFMRGRTLANAYVILDEAQNTTAAQMKMFLTRLGEGSRMVITGDPSQIDLPTGQISGLKDAARVLDGIPDIGFTKLEANDIVRHPLVHKIVTAYESKDGK